MVDRLWELLTVALFGDESDKSYVFICRRWLVDSSAPPSLCLDSCYRANPLRF